MKIKIMIIIGFLFLVFSSCKDWLDVKMNDNIMENTLYSTNEGFLIALNGVYVGLQDIYGSDLSAGVIDVMAQYYNVTENNNHSYKIYAGYKYGEDVFETKSSTIWSTAYTLLANINVLLEHCDDPATALRADYYPLVKGEALALRAMIHFDLLRLYGPIYSETTASQITIPYQETSLREIQPLLSASEIVNKVICDLTDALELLSTCDPVLTEGVQNAVPSDDGLDRYDFAYRQLRLNYYAVQALLARVYLWQGDKLEAYRVAKEKILDKITTEDLEVFPWVTLENVTDEKKTDRLFSSEVFFAIYDQSRANVYTSLFSEDLSLTSRLTFVGNGISDSKVSTFYDESANDWRAKYLWAVHQDEEVSDEDESEEGEEDESTNSSLYFLKYAEPESDANLDGSETYVYMIPLIRLSEVYLIAAECASSDEEALEYINTIRRHRNCQDLTEGMGKRETLVLNEFAREVIGEGQLFFFYKRLGLESFPSGASATDVFQMNLGNYVWPLPSVEVDKRTDINF